MNQLKHSDTGSAIIAFALLMAEIFLWRALFFDHPSQRPIFSFLNVGAGDAELITLPGSVAIMIDGGPDQSVVAALAKIVPTERSYIDIAIISSTDLNNFNGYNYVLDHYAVGAFLYNGRVPTQGDVAVAWQVLVKKIQSRHIPLVTLSAGDRIAYGSFYLAILSPDHDFARSSAPGDSDIVTMATLSSAKILYASNVSTQAERFLMGMNQDLRAAVLKVPAHGSTGANGQDFLNSIDPQLAVMEAGGKTAAGRPSKQALLVLASATNATILRTDTNGIINAWFEAGKIHFTKEN